MKLAQFPTELSVAGPTPDAGGRKGAPADEAGDEFAALVLQLDGGEKPSGDADPVAVPEDGQVAAAPTPPVIVALSAQLQAALAAASLNGAGEAIAPGAKVDVQAENAMSAKGALDAWAKGPSAGAAMTTGALSERPMQLAVLNVETHFAPVMAASASAENDGDTAIATGDDDTLAMPATPAKAAPLTVPAVAGRDSAFAGGAFAGGEGAPAGGAADHAQGREIVGDTSGIAEGAVAIAETGEALLPGHGVAKQISDAVVRAAASDGAPVPTGQVAGSQIADQGRQLGKLKILEIQLQPESLGSVTVRMQLRETGLELHLIASRSATVEAITRDREVLGSLLRSAGYAADDTQIRISLSDAMPAAPTVTTVTAAAATAGSDLSGNGGNPSGASAWGQSQSGSQSSGDRSGGSRPRGDNGQRAAGLEGSVGDSASAGRSSQAQQGLYL